ncbi:hypothetical protein GCM10014715_79520 [Streptomyces spiralis]|uniref:Uncharacterized protein n=1 Tax=Streptomyces spiralis TaxID=66376 RepID=A0A919AK15_9ACTN|nr:hypothetical protein GCM10014715_79520 [Streptomyces spiralis]
MRQLEAADVAGLYQARERLIDGVLTDQLPRILRGADAPLLQLLPHGEWSGLHTGGKIEHDLEQHHVIQGVD